MKRSAWYLTCIFALGGMFSACYYLSYRNALKKFEEKEKQQELNRMVDAGQQAEDMFLALTGIVVGNGNSAGSNSGANSNNGGNSNGGINDNNNGSGDGVNGENSIVGPPPAQEMTENLTAQQQGQQVTGQQAEGQFADPEDYGEAVPADAVKEAKILPGTKILVETYEITTGNFSTAEKQPDSALIGMTREQLLNYLAEELENMPVSEFEKGLYANELITFSENKVIVRKTYDADRVDFLYYLAVKNGEVVVYYSDLKTVFEYTGIRAIDLREEERLALLEGIRIGTAEELFSLLESYSS